jgi:hypothetical protein
MSRTHQATRSPEAPSRGAADAVQAHPAGPYSDRPSVEASGFAAQAALASPRAGIQLSPDEDVQLKGEPRKKVSSKAMKRIGLARDAIKHAKSVFSFGAGNQADALKDSNFNSYFRLKVMRDATCWDLAPSVKAIAAGNREALTAAKADLAHGGNCGEHATVGFDYLRWKAPGETIARSNVTGLDHAFVLMGDPGKEEDSAVTVCDPWPTSATACTWEDHFAYTSDKSKLNRKGTMVADGKNVKAVIAAGLKLSARGEAMCKTKFPTDRTEKELEKGLGNWIWEHPNAAETEYEYFAEGDGSES